MQTKLWKEAEEFVERKINDAKREGKKVKAMIRPPESAEVERTVQSSQAAFGVEKMQMNDCKNLLQLVKPMFRSQVYLDYHKQHGVSSEVVIPDKEDQALEFPYGSIQHGQSSMIYNVRAFDELVLSFILAERSKSRFLSTIFFFLPYLIIIGNNAKINSIEPSFMT